MRMYGADSLFSFSVMVFEIRPRCTDKSLAVLGFIRLNSQVVMFEWLKFRPKSLLLSVRNFFLGFCIRNFVQYFSFRYLFLSFKNPPGTVFVASRMSTVTVDALFLIIVLFLRGPLVHSVYTRLLPY